MAGETLAIQITAKDGASQVFAKVGQAAKQSGADAEAGLKRAQSGIEGLNTAGIKWGAIGGAVMDVTRAATSAFAESEAAQARLQTAVENTGASFTEFQAQMEAASQAAVQLGFDDEDAADALASLTQMTGSATTALNDLGLVEDLARARKISLAEAAKMVGMAENDRLGALARVVPGIDATMSKEEALAKLREMSAGQAEAYANTTAGAIDRMQAEVGNKLEALGGHLQGLTPYLQLSGLVTQNWTALGAVIGAVANPVETVKSAIAGMQAAFGAVQSAISSVGTALSGSAAASEAAAVGMGAAGTASAVAAGEMEGAAASAGMLELALGPVGLAIIGITAAVAGFKVIGDQLGAADEAIGRTEAASKQLHSTLESLSDVNLMPQALQTVNALDDRMTALRTTIDTTEHGWLNYVEAVALAKLTNGAYTGQAGENIETVNEAKHSIEELTAVQEAYNAILQQSGPETEEITNRVGDLIDQWLAGTLSTKDLKAALAEANAEIAKAQRAYTDAGGSLKDYNTQVQMATSLQDKFHQSWLSLMTGMEGGWDKLNHIATSTNASAMDAQTKINAAFAELNTALNDSDPTNDIAAWQKFWDTVTGVDADLTKAEAPGNIARESANNAIDEQNRIIEHNSVILARNSQEQAAAAAAAHGVSIAYRDAANVWGQQANANQTQINLAKENVTATDAQRRALEQTTTTWGTMAKANQDATDKLRDWTAALNEATDPADNIARLMSSFASTVETNTSPALIGLTDDLAALNDSVEYSAVVFEAYQQALLDNNWDAFRAKVHQARLDMEAESRAVEHAAGVWGNMAAANQAGIDAEKAKAAAAKETSDAYREQARVWGQQANASQTQINLAKQGTKATQDETAALKERAAAGAAQAKQAVADAEAQRQAWDAQTQSILEAAKALGLYDTATEQLLAAGFTAEPIQLAVDVTGATEAVGTLKRVIIDNTTNLASQADAIDKWALELIGVRGQYAKIDDLKAKGLVTDKQYEAAQKAQEKISTANAKIQEQVLAIQAKQAPTIAAAVEEQAKYLEKVGEMEGREQLAALGFMDATESAKAMQIAMLAASGTSGETFEAIVKGAAEADPALAAMLEQMGYISIGADGTITVNTAKAQGSMDKLNDSINNLTIALAQIYHLDINHDGIDDATQSAEKLKADLDALDGKNVTVTVTTVAVNPINQGGPSMLGGVISPHLLGGVSAPTPRYALGGRMALVGESGPELVSLPYGSMVTPATATRQQLGQGSGMNIYGPITIVANDPKSFARQLSARRLAEARQ